jgi:hypothetical protein
MKAIFDSDEAIVYMQASQIAVKKSPLYKLPLSETRLKRLSQKCDSAQLPQADGAGDFDEVIDVGLILQRLRHNCVEFAPQAFGADRA